MLAHKGREVDVDANEAVIESKKVPLQVKLTPPVARFLRLKGANERRDVSEIVESLLMERFGGDCVPSAMMPVVSGVAS